MDLSDSAALSVERVPPEWRGTMEPRPWLGFWRGLLAPRAAVAATDGAGWQAAARRRRRALLLWVLAATVLATAVMARTQPLQGQGLLQWLQTGLFSLLFAWVSAGCLTALMGFTVLLRGDRHTLSGAAADLSQPLGPDARTALVMPICNEDVATVFAGLRATCESLLAAGGGRHFDVFVLSDTPDAALRAEEEQAWAALQAALLGRLRIHYRVREQRGQKKAGNVADFCRRWGRGYRYMVVLDADSVMSGDALMRLLHLMEANPRAGILQTAPRPCGHLSLHARAQQFASRVGGPLFTAGMQFWQLGEAHYWGHNAIIRVEPFMQHCALAPLPGHGALAGDILSHDFVEAALMRRAGYQVWLVGDLGGSFEQPPPNLSAELQRDRRWAMGNLQNARLIAEPGLHPVHRAMLATGAMSYLSAPLWLGYIALGLLSWLAGGEARVLPQQLGAGALALWAGTLLMLLLPRALGVALVMLRGQAGEFGGGTRLLGSAALEAGLAALQAPLRMLAHSLFVLGAFTGWKLEWKSPPRSAERVRWQDALRFFGPASLLAAAAVIGLAAAQAQALLWLLPVALPLVFAVPLAVWTSQLAPGLALRHARLLLIPEEAQAPPLLRRAWALAHEAR
ncbi:MAG: glucans biosynthesis glucosyltransferase MdoH [Rubrivivax sp.]